MGNKDGLGVPGSEETTVPYVTIKKKATINTTRNQSKWTKGVRIIFFTIKLYHASVRRATLITGYPQASTKNSIGL
jgi:hypothetical protein